MREIVQEDLAQLEQLKARLFPQQAQKHIERLGGLTNHTYAITLDDGTYTFRLPGVGTEALIDRQDEKKSTELACALGIDAKLLYFDPETGIKVSAYIEHAVTMDPDSMRTGRIIDKAARLLYTLHSCGEDTGVSFEVFEMAERYEHIIRSNSVQFYGDYDEIRKKVMRIKAKSDRLDITKVPCHNDPLCENWIEALERMYLVDWEYAGMNDPMWDLADLSIEADYDAETDTTLLKAYFGEEPNADLRFRFLANKINLDFLWSLWGKTRVPFEGAPMEQYALDRYIRLKKNLALPDLIDI